MRIVPIVAVLAGLTVSGSPADGARVPSQPELATNCQSALIDATTSFAQNKIKQLDKCTAAAFKCIQTVAPDDEADVDPIEACLEKASLRCAKAADVIAAEEQRLREAIVEACTPLYFPELLSEGTVGYGLIASDCLDLGVTVEDATSVAECVVRQHVCAVDQLYLAENPRAGELFGLVAADLGPDSCLDDLGGPGEGVDDVKLGRQIARCEQGVAKVAGTFTTTRLKSLGSCLEAVFTCVQLAAHDGGKCLAKAAAACDKAFALAERNALAIWPALEKSCGSIAFGELLRDAGANYQVLVDEETCPAFGVSGLATTSHYALCLRRQHDCIGNALVRFTAPRAEELLALVGRTLPGDFFCVPPDEVF